MDFEGLLDGVAFKGGTADQSVQLGGGRMIPGFEDGILVTRQDEFEINVTFPRTTQQEAGGQACRVQDAA